MRKERNIKYVINRLEFLQKFYQETIPNFILLLYAYNKAWLA